MPEQLLFLLLHFGLRNHQAIYFFSFFSRLFFLPLRANRYMPVCTMIPVSRLLRYFTKFFDARARNICVFALRTNTASYIGIYMYLDIQIKINRHAYVFTYASLCRITWQAIFLAVIYTYHCAWDISRRLVDFLEEEENTTMISGSLRRILIWQKSMINNHYCLRDNLFLFFFCWSVVSRRRL